MTPAIEKLRACTDADELSTALHQLCVSFGAVNSLRIIEAGKPGQRQMLCFLRFENIDARQRFSTEFNVGSFGGELILIVDLHAAATEIVVAENAMFVTHSSPTTWKLPDNNRPNTK